MMRRGQRDEDNEMCHDSENDNEETKFPVENECRVLKIGREEPHASF